MILVDSDVLIAHLRGVVAARDWLVSARKDGPLAISVVSTAELIGGMRTAERREVWRRSEVSSVSCPRSVPRHRKWWFQLLEHGEMPHVEGCQLQVLDVGGSSYQIVAKSNPVVAATISAHHVAGAACDYLGCWLYPKRCKQAPHSCIVSPLSDGGPRPRAARH